jgi:lipid-A-disaccharide synthase-like uncharacterized protein
MPDWFWLVFGFAGQACFAGRFLVQWIASERRRRSVVPPAFWVLSLAGGVAILVYAVHRRDPVIVTGQAAGLFVYSRNLYLHRARQRRLHGRSLSRRRSRMETGDS